MFEWAQCCTEIVKGDVQRVQRGVRKFVTQPTESGRIFFEIPMIYCVTGDHLFARIICGFHERVFGLC